MHPCFSLIHFVLASSSYRSISAKYLSVCVGGWLYYQDWRANIKAIDSFCFFYSQRFFFFRGHERVEDAQIFQVFGVRASITIDPICHTRQSFFAKGGGLVSEKIKNKKKWPTKRIIINVTWRRRRRLLFTPRVAFDINTHKKKRWWRREQGS